jgi:hypothetical protein
VSDWEVRVWWTASPGAAAPDFTLHTAADENQAIDEAVSVADGARHPWLPVKARRVEIRAAGSEWRPVAVGRAVTFR